MKTKINQKSVRKNSKVEFALFIVALIIFSFNVSAKNAINYCIVVDTINTDLYAVIMLEKEELLVKSILKQENSNQDVKSKLSLEQLSALVESDEEPEIELEYWMLDFDHSMENYDFSTVEKEDDIELEAWMLDTELFSEMFKDVDFYDDAPFKYIQTVEEHELQLEDWMLSVELFQEKFGSIDFSNSQSKFYVEQK